ncbi:Gfo/Idh/MocA family protein [Lentimicrobium sp. S6]|uniref:Gfo/Idh/MocA family protein n=1 Tax=Lentimicrobium sp. S6 TaxID=2735872 RepID=UPI0015566E11|nr:Gfo/Idh/MocA family oxidoreductase [Lentimicrobium sp. S6]NPD46725.1 Gfo/Idh/MocA family oxidoreductase [Lentimicrobium sp. S6]
MDKKLNFAIVGCGRIGIRHAEHIIKYAALVAVCDTVKQKAEELAKQYNINGYYSINELLDKEPNIDIVSICTPNGLHAEHSIASLEKGMHVLCEKPMGINVHECGEMIKSAERANKRLFVVKQNRFNPPVVALKKLLEENKLGKIYTVQLNCFWNRNSQYYSSSEWKGTKALDGGTLFTQFSHFIDLLYYLVGDVKETYAFAGNFNHQDEIEFEDNGVVALKFYNGTLGTINYTVNSYQKNMEGSITIFAEKGTVKIGGQYLNELEYQAIEGISIDNLPKGNPPNMYGQYIGSMSNHSQVYENVVDVLSNDGIIATNGYEGLKTVEIIDKIYASIQKTSSKNEY